MRYLFANVIDEEIKRDEAHRQILNEGVEKRQAAARANPPTSIELPSPGFDGAESATTPRANGTHYPSTPGMAIALATPGASRLADVPEGAATPQSPLEKRSSHAGRPSGDDYFSNSFSIEGSKPAATPATPGAAAATTAAESAATEAKTPGAETGKEKEKEKEASGKSPSTPFGKKFRMGSLSGMSFGTKKIGRSASTNTEKPVVVEEKAEDSESSSNHEKEVDDSFLGVIQKIRNDYDKQLAEAPEQFIETKITPSLANDTPVLKLSPSTKVFIQEETSGGSANLYQGTVESVGRDTDLIEQRGPMWLGDVLLQNQTPLKDPVKVSFVLQPWDKDLPDLAVTDGNNRLNANRMLRVKKILGYIAERIEPQPEEPDPDALKPEEYLELYCNDMVSVTESMSRLLADSLQKLPITLTLATLRAHIWKGGSDIMLYYKANGRKEIKKAPPPPAPEPEAEPEPEAAEDATNPPAAASGTATTTAAA